MEGPDAKAAAATVVDLAGGTLLPGFIDAHMHPVFAGDQLRRCDLSGAVTHDAYLRIISDYVGRNPGDGWVTGGGWSMEAFPGGVPTAAPLDEIAPDRPVYLPNRDGHGAWVNSKAMQLAGITRDSLNPADGRIERDANGDPVGMLQEGAANLVSRLLPGSPRRTGTRHSGSRRTTCSRSASPAGRTPSSADRTSRATRSRRTCARPSAARCAPAWSARCGGTGTAAWTSSPS